MNVTSHLARPRIVPSDRKNVIRQHADRIAAERDALVKKNAAYYGEDRRYMRFLISTGSRVLDLGCGTGDLLAALEPSLGVGVDFAPELLKQAVQRHPQLRFVQGDVHQLNLN